MAARTRRLSLRLCFPSHARVVENPSCRQSRWACNSLPKAERPPGCSDPRVPKTVQERAWTSPIWYTPPASDAR